MTAKRLAEMVIDDIQTALIVEDDARAAVLIAGALSAIAKHGNVIPPEVVARIYSTTINVQTQKEPA